METKIEDKHLVIRIPLEEPSPSASGKTMLIASTHGNQRTKTQFANHDVVVSVNAYYKP